MKRWKRKYFLLFASKLIEKSSDPWNTIEHMNQLKQLEIITHQPKAFDTVDTKSHITEHSKTLLKLSKTIRQAENLSCSNFGKFLNEKNVKLTKRELVFKDFVSTYNVQILNFFNPKQPLTDTESAIKSKLIELLAHLRGFKSVTKLVLVFKKMVWKQSLTNFIQAQKQK